MLSSINLHHFIAQCENNIAAAGHTLNVIYMQTAILEELLEKNKLTFNNDNLSLLRVTIAEWIKQLYDKFAFIITQSNTEIEEFFPIAICENLPRLKSFHTKIHELMEFLKRENFFTEFSEKLTLQEKYTFIFSFQEKIEQKNKGSAPLESLLFNIASHVLDAA